MGNWTLVIHGTGPHHNDKDYDVEKLAAVFVQQLQANGHSIQDARVNMGSTQEIPKTAPVIGDTILMGRDHDIGKTP